MKDIRVKFGTGKSTTYTIKNSGTLQDLMDKTGINPVGYNVKANGKSVEMTDELVENTLCTFAEKIKGGAMRRTSILKTITLTI